MTFPVRQSSNGVNFGFQYDEITLYLNLIVLLYADDTSMFGTDGKDFLK